MAKRKLVEVTREHHRMLERIRKACKTAKVQVPSVPFLLEMALDIAGPALIQKYMPEDPGSE